MTETETTSTATPATLPDTQTPHQAGRYARNDPASFAAGEETTPEKDAAERGNPASFAAGEETTPEKDAAERGHPGSFGDEEPKA